MNKHAYMVMAHCQFGLLEILLQLLDDERNDIYLHIDKKVKNFDFNHYKKIVKKSKLIFLPRQNITWGDYSQIKCEIIALKIALKNASRENYTYFHWISGVDLPIKSQNEIHHYFEINSGYEFIHFDSERISTQYLDRVRWYRLPRVGRDCEFVKRLSNYFIVIQRKLKIDRIRKADIEFQKGSAFWSISRKMAEYIVSKEKWIKKHFAYTHCGDELFIQTVIVNSPYKEKIYWKRFDNNIIKSSGRFIDWEKGTIDGSPKTLKKDDFSKLIESEAMFARKFDFDKSPDIIYLIKKHLEVV